MGTYIIRDAYEKIQEVTKERGLQVKQGRPKTPQDSAFVDHRGQGPGKKANSD